MKNNWNTWTVRYWNHETRHDGTGSGYINDCHGNSISWVGKARTEQEALRKAKYHNSIHNAPFRLHYVKIAA